MILQTSSHPTPLFCLSCLPLLPLSLSPFCLSSFFTPSLHPSFLLCPPPPFHHSPSTYPTASWSVHTVWCRQLYQSFGTECAGHRHVRRPASPTHHDQILRHIGHHTNTSTTNFSQFSAAVINSEIMYCCHFCTVQPPSVTSTIICVGPAPLVCRSLSLCIDESLCTICCVMLCMFYLCIVCLYLWPSLIGADFSNIQVWSSVLG